MQNFKSVGQAEVSLRPLTVLVGPNSAGKSSLIQSILLFVQAQSSYERSDLLSLNGSLVRLGTYDEVRRKGGTGKVVLGGTLVQTPRIPVRRGAQVRVFDDDEATSIAWDTRLGRGPQETPGSMRTDRVTLRVGIKEPLRSTSSGQAPGQIDASIRLIWKRNAKPTSGVAVLGREFGRYTNQIASRDETERLEQYVGEMRIGQTGTRVMRVKLGGGLPIAGVPSAAYGRGSVGEALLLAITLDRYAPGASGPSDELRREDDAVAAASAAAHSFLERWPTFREILVAGEDDGQPDSLRLTFEAGKQQRVLEGIAAGVPRRNLPEFAAQFLSILKENGVDGDVLFDALGGGPLAWARDVVTQYLAIGVQYLGPIRTAPRTVASDAQYSRGVGVEGETTAAALHGDRNMTVRFVGPGSPNIRSATLGEAVNEWMQALDLADSVTTKDRGRYGIEVTVRQKGVDADLNLRNVGVGVSQVLPLVVLCLRSRPDSLILVEQPELHLHPAAQQQLADFLLAMIASGRQLIVETHSDHMITRLRRRIVEDEADRLRDRVGFVYVTRSDDTGETEYREVAANEYGGFADWPHGFFEQGQQEAAALIRAAVARKSARDGGEAPS